MSGNYLTRKEAVQHLHRLGCKISVSALAKMRDRGPPYILFLNRITAYDRDQLEAWARQHAKQKGGKPVVVEPQPTPPAAGALRAAAGR